MKNFFIILLLLVNLGILAFFISQKVPTFMEVVVSFYAPTIVACLGCIWYLIKGKGTLVFVILTIISLVAPTLVTVGLIENYKNKKYREQLQLELNRPIEWINEHCKKNETSPTNEGLIKYECDDKSSRYYLPGGGLMRIERSPSDGQVTEFNIKPIRK